MSRIVHPLRALIDSATGRELAVLRGHENGVQSVAWSPDGGRIVSGSISWDGKDKTVRVWDAESGECLEVIQGAGDVAAKHREHREHGEHGELVKERGHLHLLRPRE